MPGHDRLAKPALPGGLIVSRDPFADRTTKRQVRATLR
jgi:hypothetical protein